MPKIPLSYSGFKFEVDPSDLLFLAVSGSHSYGTARSDSDLDLRGVVFPSFRDAIRLQGSQMKTQFYKLTDDIDVEFVPIRKWLQILLKGNGNYLENLWQEKVYPKEYRPWEDYLVEQVEKRADIINLKQLVMKHALSKKYRNHYIGFAKSQQKDFFQRYKTKCLLYVYRVLMSGIVLYRHGNVEYNVKEMARNPVYRPSFPADVINHVDILIRNFDNEQSIMNEPFKDRVQKDFDALEHRLNEYCDESDFPDKANYEPFNEWLENKYRLELCKA